MKKSISFVGILILLVVIFHLTPTGAIRFYVALHSGPVAAAKAKITPGGFHERHWATSAYGWQFSVEGGGEKHFFYLMRNTIGLWVITSAGTGP